MNYDYDYDYDDGEEMGAPDCFGSGDYACGSEECDFCKWEEWCSPLNNS